MDQQAEQNNFTQDEKLLGLFAHLSMFFGSLIIPLIFWIIQKDKSRFVSFHSLQALFFHIVYTVILIFIALAGALAAMAVGLIQPGVHHQSSPNPIQIIVILALAVIIFGFIICSIALAIINAISAYKGGMKKYPIIGNIVYRKVYGLN